MRHGRFFPLGNALLIVGLALLADVGAAQPASERMKLLPDSAEIKANFGYSVATSGGRIVVGAWQQGNGESTTQFTYTPRADGAAYVFDARTGEQLHRLVPSEGLTPFDRFGVAVAINGDLIAVGSQGADTGTFGEPGFLSNSGTVHIFDAATGAEIREIQPPEPGAGDFFGRAVAIEDGTLVVGVLFDDDQGEDAGSAYVFDAITGQQTFRLVPSDPTPGAEFGWAVAIEGDVIAVGARYAPDQHGVQTGAVYLFDKGTGVQIRKIEPPFGGFSGDSFGIALDIEDNALVIGAPFDRSVGLESGSVYVYDIETGDLMFDLQPTDHEAQELFGRGVAISEGLIAVGIRSSDDNGLHAGAVHLFDASTGEQIRKLLPSDGRMGQAFGWKVSGDRGLFAITAPHDSHSGGGIEAGAAYIFDLGCPSDLNHDGITDSSDLNDWIQAFLNGTSSCDQNGDGLCTPSDFSAWIANSIQCKTTK